METKHTPGKWTCRIWATDDDPEKLRKIGLQPVPALTNDGARYIMAGPKRVALVDCQTDFKRGKGHQTECAERDANARLIADAPDVLAERDRLRAVNAELVKALERCQGLASSNVSAHTREITNAIFDTARAALERAKGAE